MGRLQRGVRAGVAGRGSRSEVGREVRLKVSADKQSSKQSSKVNITIFIHHFTMCGKTRRVGGAACRTVGNFAPIT